MRRTIEAMLVVAIALDLTWSWRRRGGLLPGREEARA
jgi:hypothetical protein